MKNFMQLISSLFFLVILLAAPGMKMVQGQQICEARSINFRGMCMKWRNCQRVCMSEGFPDGRCAGFIRRCICRKPCPILS
ncbi:hypothetical protein EUTSA_v10017942mg [Eutrema salsugineum]|uniref:Knottins-like domain-containing protein n=1 Tax=Eutrema salsugineum TaxID=72664 RepID=V4M9J7_EUTSA|nr:putative defensin-like protein 9 [Eutrema salsugineum]ESQ51782.1 hypothetical protein EUTSA_v10017942mg [Eutrema salsugineum]